MGREIENSLSVLPRRKYTGTIPSMEDVIREMLVLSLDHGAVSFYSGYKDGPIDPEHPLCALPKDKREKLMRAISGVWDPYLGRCYREAVDTYYETSIFTVSDPVELYRRIRRSEQIVGFFARKLSTENYAVRAFNAVSDRRGIAARACGHHNNFLQTRRFFDRLFCSQAPNEDVEARGQNIRMFSPTAQDLMSAWPALLPLRGAGKIGSDCGNDHVSFQISERADFVSYLIGANTYEERPLINSRDEPHANPARFSRIHMIHGEGYRFPWTAFFDAGLTALILAALDEDAFRLPWMLKNPVWALVQISRDPDFREKIPIIIRPNGALEERPTLVLLRDVLKELEGGYARWAHLPSWCDMILGEAITVVDQLIGGEYANAERMIDWMIKKRFLEDVMEEKFGLNPDEASSWFHPRVRAIDLDHHRLDDDRLLETEAAQCEVRDWETYRMPYGVPEEERFWTQGEPHDTRSYLYWLLTTHPEWKHRVEVLDWSKIKIWSAAEKNAAIVPLEDPRKFGKSHVQFLIERDNLNFSHEEDRARFIEELVRNTEYRHEPSVHEIPWSLRRWNARFPFLNKDIDQTRELELRTTMGVALPAPLPLHRKELPTESAEAAPTLKPGGCLCCLYQIPHSHYGEVQPLGGTEEGKPPSAPQTVAAPEIKMREPDDPEQWSYGMLEYPG